jgi:hypothetical protein
MLYAAIHGNPSFTDGLISPGTVYYSLYIARIWYDRLTG